MAIYLDKEKGVNPRLTSCRRCGEAVGVALMGNKGYKEICQACGMVYYGGRDVGVRSCVAKRLNEHDKEVACGGTLFNREPLEDMESIPCELCDTCAKEIEEHRKVVEEGGIYWQCSDCRASGVIKSNSPICAAVRKQTGIEPPGPVGVEFQKEPVGGLSCPACGPDADELKESDEQS